MQRHACESEFGRKGGGELMGNILRRGEIWFVHKV
jgi:hypothetical protein